MRPDREIFYVVVGDRARDEHARSLECLRNVSADPVRVIGERREGMTDKQASRWAKLSLDQHAQAGQALYLDADTRPRQDFSAAWGILDDGWDLVMAPSAHQGEDCLWHVGESERGETFGELGFVPLQLQAGIMFIKWNERTRALWAEWRREYMRYQDEDQGAFLRALHKIPVRLWMLGHPYNGGAVINHLCGRVRR